MLLFASVFKGHSHFLRFAVASVRFVEVALLAYELFFLSLFEEIPMKGSIPW